eukprot:symbB.v1.2.005794.t1/scaffold317.1/size229983/5
MHKLNASRRESSPRLCEPKWDETTRLKQRATKALAKSASMPSLGPEASFEDLRKAMKVHALRKKHGLLTKSSDISPPSSSTFKFPQGLGKYNYTVPAQALPFIRDFKEPMSEPLPLLPKAYWSGSACAR